MVHNSQFMILELKLKMICGSIGGDALLSAALRIEVQASPSFSRFFCNRSFVGRNIFDFDF